MMTSYVALGRSVALRYMDIIATTSAQGLHQGLSQVVNTINPSLVSEEGKRHVNIRKLPALVMQVEGRCKPPQKKGHDPGNR